MELLESPPVPQLVVGEAAYLIGRRLGAGAEVNFLGDLARGSLGTQPVHPADWLRIAELVGQYRDLPLGTADASLVAPAERLGIDSVATLDRRHLSVVKPVHVDRLRLLPDPDGG